MATRGPEKSSRCSLIVTNWYWSWGTSLLDWAKRRFASTEDLVLRILREFPSIFVFLKKKTNVNFFCLFFDRFTWQRWSIPQRYRCNCCEQFERPRRNLSAFWRFYSSFRRKSAISSIEKRRRKFCLRQRKLTCSLALTKVVSATFRFISNVSSSICWVRRSKSISSVGTSKICCWLCSSARRSAFCNLKKKKFFLKTWKKFLSSNLFDFLQRQV